MAKRTLSPAETLGTSQEGTLVIEQFLMTNHCFRQPMEGEMVKSF